MDDTAWPETVATFRDANPYQLWHTGSVSGRFTGTSRLVLKRCEATVAAAEVRTFLVPLLGRGVAYVRWGPLWRPSVGVVDLDDFKQVIRALKNEYVYRRNLILRLNPRLFAERDQSCAEILRQEGFNTVGDPEIERTLLMNLAPDLDALRRGLDKKWRNCLSKAERSSLTIEVGHGMRLFDEFTTVYREMLVRKGFTPTADLGAHRCLQQALPDTLKMQLVIARDGGQPCAGAIISSIGDTALYLFGATNEDGMRTCASYLVQWEVLKILKGRGVSEYDLHGINPERNPNTYHFKRGLAGTHGTEVTFGAQVQGFRPWVSNRSLLLAESWYRTRRGWFARVKGRGAALWKPSRVDGSAP